MASTQADLDALIRARNTGALRVTYGDPPRTVQYRTLEEIEATIRRIQGELGLSVTDRFSRVKLNRG